MFIQIFIRDTGTLKLYIPLHRSSTGYTYRPYAAAAAGAAVQSVKLYKRQEVSRISAPTLHWLHPQLGNVRCSNCCSLAPSHGAYLLHYVQLRQQPFDAVFELRQSSQRFWRLQLSCVVQPTLQNCGKKWAVWNCNSLTIKTGEKPHQYLGFSLYTYLIKYIEPTLLTVVIDLKHTKVHWIGSNLQDHFHHCDQGSDF